MKTSVCGILDFETKRSRPFAFFLLLLQSQNPDLLLLLNCYQDVMVIWLDFLQIDNIDIGGSYSSQSIKETEIVKQKPYGANPRSEMGRQLIRGTELQ